MHDAFAHLSKRVAAVQQALGEVLVAVERQSGIETKRLEEVAYGDAFDPRQAPGQEHLVAALTEALEALEAADDGLSTARQALDEAPQR